MMSPRQVLLIALPMIRLKTSPTLIGRKPGFLSSGISFEAKRAGRESSWILFLGMHNFLAIPAIDLHKLTLYVPNEDEVRIRFHPSESKLDGPGAPRLPWISSA